MVTNNRYAAAVAVARGATLLDAKLPGWWKRVDLDSLDLRSDDRCVLGQVYDDTVNVPRWRAEGWRRLKDAIASRPNRTDFRQKVCVANYTLGTAMLGLQFDATIQYGFNAGMVFGEGHTTYSGLDVAWAELIRGRQSLAVLEARHPELAP